VQNMSGVANRVFKEALSLPLDERMNLVEKLLTSLNLPIQLPARFWVVCRFSEEAKSSLPGTLYHIIGWKRIWSRAAKAK
jgi:hypothetical protein